nr:hypothetical protein [Candidatus Sigynarchaeota archaeon]
MNNSRRRRGTTADGERRCKVSSRGAGLEGIVATRTGTPVFTRIAHRPRQGSWQQGRFVLENQCGGTARMRPVVARHQGLFSTRNHRLPFMPRVACRLHISESASVRIIVFKVRNHVAAFGGRPGREIVVPGIPGF